MDSFFHTALIDILYHMNKHAKKYTDLISFYNANKDNANMILLMLRGISVFIYEIPLLVLFIIMSIDDFWRGFIIFPAFLIFLIPVYKNMAMRSNYWLQYCLHRILVINFKFKPRKIKHYDD